jgi:hypothetical protein
MNNQLKWHGGIAIGARSCDECSTPAAVLYEIGISARGERGRWACRACVLDPVRRIGAIDRRGDVLHGLRIPRELDAQTAIVRHLEARDRAENGGYSDPTDGPASDSRPSKASNTPLPASYQHVLSALDRCRRVDAEFATVISELRERYEQAAFFSPKQLLLVQWRLSKNGIMHDPGCFVVSTRSEKEIAQIRGFDDWRKKKIAVYLSWQQRGRWGF